MESKFSVEQLFENTLIIKELERKTYIGYFGDAMPVRRIKKQDIILWFQSNFEDVEIINGKEDK